MASIKKLDNGWRYRVSYKEGGKYKTKTKGGFRTKRECEIEAGELEKKYAKGYSLTAGDQLFSEYMWNWFNIYKKGKHTKGHEDNIKRSIKLVEKHFAGVKIKDITRDMYQQFLNDISKNYATDTVRKRHTYIKACLKDAIEDGVIFKDPTHKAIIKGHKESKSEELKYLHFDDVKKLINETKKDMKQKYISRYIIIFAIATGARFSEIMGMTWDCVDFEKKSITINKAWDFKDKYDFGNTKNFDSLRTITIDKDTIEILKELKASQEKIAKQLKIKNKKNLVFINTKMQLVSNNAVNKTLKSLLKKAGIKKEITLHSLRHTHASMLLYRGINIKYISRRLGHKDIVTTLQVYSHIMDEMEQKESRQVDKTMAELHRKKPKYKLKKCKINAKFFQKL